MTIISRGVEISIAGGVVAMVCVIMSWSPFFFFFCNHAFIVFRYKKPYAALAMERTKHINQKHKHRKVTAPISIHYRAGFSSAGPSATYNKESTNSQLSRLKRKAYIR